MVVAAVREVDKLDTLNMPFISQDWRGPGEDWVRGQDGWETRRVARTDLAVVRRRGKSETEVDKENRRSGAQGQVVR